MGYCAADGWSSVVNVTATPESDHMPSMNPSQSSVPKLAKAFDGYLDAYDPDELNKGNTLFDLYKAWRDQCKVASIGSISL